MPIYVYWGEDDFAREREVKALRDRILDPNWGSFNFDKIPPENPNASIEGLNQAMTPPFGGGGRLVWLVETRVCHQCSAELLKELQRSVKAIPDTSVLLLTTRQKPDSRLKSTKLLKEVAEFREFSPIPPWKTEMLEKRVRDVARELGVKLTSDASTLLAEAVGNDTRQLFGELEKLQLYVGEGLVKAEAVEQLVTATAQNSLQLAKAIRHGRVEVALDLVSDLIARNEPVLRIVATLTGQFRMWLWVKLMVESRERDDKAIAVAADLGNPKRVYFLRQEVDRISLAQLQQTLPVLLTLEAQLKRGADEIATLQMKVIELCGICCK
ncbi:MAG: DNA polymerase III subunit delta [Cyanobacteria bacterium SID2]|nr:DNA polymerase III subunit delta [Cyanobacteria bacterium SID2]MBP0005319.1 DNA polymerase III subunit delta [Cyanobacteria bacterium SBC]